MKNAVKLYTFLTLVFIVIYSVAAMLGGVAGEIARVLAFALPVAVGFVAALRLKREREEIAGVAERERTLLELDLGAVRSTLTVAAPFVALVFLVSYLTSLLLGLIGFEGNTVENAPIVEMLLLHALMPAVLEELMFRYLPMKLIAPYSRRWCVILSSLYFALIHMNLFQIPYALIAGAVFILLDLAYDSVWPSFFLHFANNAVSVLWIKYSAYGSFATWYVIVMVALALLSLVPIVLRRREYLGRLKSALDVGETLTECNSPMLLTAFCLIMAALNLFV